MCIFIIGVLSIKFHACFAERSSNIQKWTVDGIESMNEDELCQLLSEYEQEESSVHSTKPDIAVSSYQYVLIGVELHTNQSWEKMHVPMHVNMYVCMYIVIHMKLSP